MSLTARQKIGRFFYENPEVRLTMSEVAKKLGLNLSLVHAQLKKLAGEDYKWLEKKVARRPGEKPRVEYSFRKWKVPYLPPGPKGQHLRELTPECQDRLLLDEAFTAEEIEVICNRYRPNKLPRTEEEHRRFLHGFFRGVCDALGLDERTVRGRLYAYKIQQISEALTSKMPPEK